VHISYNYVTATQMETLMQKTIGKLFGVSDGGVDVTATETPGARDAIATWRVGFEFNAPGSKIAATEAAVAKQAGSTDKLMSELSKQLSAAGVRDRNGREVVPTSVSSFTATRKPSAGCTWDVRWNRKCLKIGLSKLRIEPLSSNFISVRPIRDNKASCAGDILNKAAGQLISSIQNFKGVEWIVGKIMVKPVISIGFPHGHWGAKDSIKWLQDEPDTGALKCTTCGEESASYVAEFTPLDILLCKADVTENRHHKFRTDKEPKTLLLPRDLLLQGLEAVTADEKWHHFQSVAEPATKMLMQQGKWWMLPPEVMAELEQQEAARDHSWAERWARKGIGEGTEKFFARFARNNMLNTLDYAGPGQKLIVKVSYHDDMWPPSPTKTEGIMTKADLMNLLVGDALGMIRPKRDVDFGGQTADERSKLDKVWNPETGIVFWRPWGEGDGDEGEGLDDEVTLGNMLEKKGVTDDTEVQVRFTRVATLEEWLSTVPEQDNKGKPVSLLVEHASGCDCEAGWAGTECNLKLPRHEEQIVVDELSVDGLVTLTGQLSHKNCVAGDPEGGQQIVCDGDLDAKLMEQGKCLDMTAAISSGHLDINKGVFKLIRPTPNTLEVPRYQKGHKTVEDINDVGEFFYLQLVGTEKYCRVHPETFDLVCDEDSPPWRCVASEGPTDPRCGSKDTPASCKGDSHCLLEALPFVFRGSLDASKDSTFWTKTFEVFLGVGAALGAMYITSIGVGLVAVLMPMSAITYTLVLGAAGLGGWFFGKGKGKAVDAQTGGGLQGLFWSVGRQMKDVRVGLWNTLDSSLQSLYEIDEHAFAGFGDILAG